MKKRIFDVDFSFQGGSDRREIKGMDGCEKWKFTDFGNEIAEVIVKLKKLLETMLDSDPII